INHIKGGNQKSSLRKHPLLSSSQSASPSSNSNHKTSILVTTKDPLMSSEQHNSDYVLL
ncbi:unnamed protein product, partial [Trichobilharzia szidati]